MSSLTNSNLDLKILSALLIGFLLFGFIGCQYVLHRDKAYWQEIVSNENSRTAADRQQHPEDWELDTTGPFTKGMWVRKKNGRIDSASKQTNLFPEARTMTPEEIKQASQAIRDIHREQGY